MWRLSVFRFTPIVAFGESISLTGASPLHVHPACQHRIIILICVVCRSLYCRLYSEEELPPEFKLFIPTAPATRGSTAGAAGGDKISLRGKEATIDKLSEVNEDEIIEETSAELRDGSDPESSEPSSDLNEMDQGNDLDEDGLIDQLHAESPRQGIALSS